MSTQSSSIENEIRSAFSETMYPGDDRLTVYDAQGRAYDRTFSLLQGRRWEDMPVEEFMCGDTPIPDLTAEAFCYYLPALLLASLQNGNLAVNVSDAMQYYLSPDAACVVGEFGFDDTRRYGRKLALLTTKQRNVIAKVLHEYVVRGWSRAEKIERTLERLMQTLPETRE